ncbi:MAG: hypothetical protein HQL31_12330, partial [Planctomycetes bacterium]|nr:hypothetical protein [Planctomycetota bacterium]
RSEEGRLATLGFSGVWYGSSRETPYDQIKSLVITDRPVYRPGQKVAFKVWVNRARYDIEGPSPYAGKNFSLQIYNAKNEKVLELDRTADEYGGMDGEIPLEENCPLGVWRITILHIGAGTFRVEEYKKPEFEVIVDTPDEPVRLGELIRGRVRAKYYFGAPVTKARVHLKVMRHRQVSSWYPPMPWDWLYGAGYGLLSCDYDWYPGFGKWGLRSPPWPYHGGWGQTPPELVLESVGELGPEGELEFSIDTEAARILHGDSDHRYQVSAEVIDESRRTISGSGSIIAAREAFRVFCWMDQGFYQAGSEAVIKALARTADGKILKTTGQWCLYRISYDDQGLAAEHLLREWKLEPDAEGQVLLRIKLPDCGQYRIACVMNSLDGTAGEGGQVFMVQGGKTEDGDYRFNDLELIPQKSEYAPGEKLRLLVNTAKSGSTVLLFIRPLNGQVSAPRFLVQESKSALEEIIVEKGDMPNFFVEALCVRDGKVLSAVREIIVPPEKRVLDLELEFDLLSISETVGELALGSGVSLRLVILELAPIADDLLQRAAAVFVAAESLDAALPHACRAIELTAVGVDGGQALQSLRSGGSLSFSQSF